MDLNLNVTFQSGVGDLTATLLRSAASETKTIGISGTIAFQDVESGDVVSIKGECAGSATITIDPPTFPATPQGFGNGNIFGIYRIL